MTRRSPMIRKPLLAVAVCAAVAGPSVGSALAGEVTGSGKNVDQNQGKSWCSFSGHNDDPGAPLDGSGPNGPRRPVAVLRAAEQARPLGSTFGESRQLLQPEQDTVWSAAEPAQVSSVSGDKQTFGRARPRGLFYHRA